MMTEVVSPKATSPDICVAETQFLRIKEHRMRSGMNNQDQSVLKMVQSNMCVRVTEGIGLIYLLTLILYL